MHVIYSNVFFHLYFTSLSLVGFKGNCRTCTSTKTDRGLPMWFPRPTVKVVPFPSRAVSVFMVTYGHE